MYMSVQHFYSYTILFSIYKILLHIMKFHLIIKFNKGSTSYKLKQLGRPLHTNVCYSLHVNYAI